MTESEDIDDPNLYRKALGYSYPSMQAVIAGGKIVHVPVVIHVPPNVEACIAPTRQMAALSL